MTVKFAGLLVGLAVIAVLIAGLWYQQRHPRRIISHDRITVPSQLSGNLSVTLETRVVAIGSRRIEEVRLPHGTWIDCGGDCRKAALEAGPEFWQTIERNTGR
ncbi:MAG: hypothetical protein ACK5JT_13420 [Hyphomicrobiaceae bacterium]